MKRAFQWDLGRQVERLDWLLAQLPRYAEWGYQELYLHLEDAVEFPSLPGVARRDAYSYQQMERLVKTADKVGIKVVPIINLLGHTQYLIKVPELRELNELVDPDGSPFRAVKFVRCTRGCWKWPKSFCPTWPPFARREKFMSASMSHSSLGAIL